MILRVWELATFAAVLAVSAIFLLGSQAIESVAFAAVATFWLVGRARVPEWLGARYVRRQATLEMVKIAALWLVLVAVVGATFVGGLMHWNRDPEGSILFLSLIGLMLLLKGDIEGRFDRYDALAAGGNTEIAVAAMLDQLEGFDAAHNWLRPDGFGNVDHIAHRVGDGEWFVIETKSGRYRPDNARQAIGCALAVKEARGLRWVTPVVCVVKASEPVREVRINNSRVWVVQLEHLAAWLPTASSTRRY